MLDPHGFGAMLQADAGVRLLTSRRAADVLAGVQPRRTDGQDKLPEYQQRRQNSKAVGEHALRATEKFRVPGPTSGEIVCNLSDKSISQRDQTQNLSVKPSVYGCNIRNLWTQLSRIDTTRRFPKNGCAETPLNPTTSLIAASDSAEVPHRSVRTNWCRQTAFGISRHQDYL